MAFPYKIRKPIKQYTNVLNETVILCTTFDDIIYIVDNGNSATLYTIDEYEKHIRESSENTKKEDPYTRMKLRAGKSKLKV